MDDYDEPRRRRYTGCPDTMCGADDCPTCRPENFRDGLYVGDGEEGEYMKQNETISAALSDASVVLQENSNTETVKVPSLTIMTPHRVGYPDQKDDPPMSVKLHASEVRALYEFLHGYYSGK